MEASVPCSKLNLSPFLTLFILYFSIHVSPPTRNLLTSRPPTCLDHVTSSHNSERKYLSPTSPCPSRCFLSLLPARYFSANSFLIRFSSTQTRTQRRRINVERTYSRAKINVTFFTNVFRHECPSQTLHWPQSSDNDVALLAGTHGTRPSAVCRANSCRLAPTNRTPPSFQHFVLTVPFPSLSFLSMKL